MEIQRHWQEELEGLRPCWFPAVFAFAESSDLRQRRMVGGCAHRFDVLFKSDREDNHFRFLPCLKHSPEVVVFPFFQCPLSFFQNPLPLCLLCPVFPVLSLFLFLFLIPVLFVFLIQIPHFIFVLLVLFLILIFVFLFVLVFVFPESLLLCFERVARSKWRQSQNGLVRLRL